jgi:ketosteroid isomerase-like protein
MAAGAGFFTPLASGLVRNQPRAHHREILRAMSQENVEAVVAAYKAFAQRGPDGFLDHLAEDVDHRAIEGAPDDRGPMHGKEAVRAYVQDWLDTFDNFTAQPIELIDAGEERVVAVIRIGGRAKLSGVETDLTFAVVYLIRDGRIARGREYATRAEALEAAGLRE